MTATPPDTRTWIAACPAADLQPERGAAVLLPGGYQAALFRTFDGRLYAVDNVDPFSRAAVLSRGIVGDRDGRPTVASPLYKNVFCLASGECLDTPGARIATLAVREHGRSIQIALPDGGS